MQLTNKFAQDIESGHQSLRRGGLAAKDTNPLDMSSAPRQEQSTRVARVPNQPSGRAGATAGQCEGENAQEPEIMLLKCQKTSWDPVLPTAYPAPLTNRSEFDPSGFCGVTGYGKAPACFLRAAVRLAVRANRNH